MATAKDVWVVVEYSETEVQEVSLEMLDEAGRLARSLGQRVCAVLIGYQVASLVQTLADYGAELVYLIQDRLLTNYTTDAYASVLSGLIKEYVPFIVLLAATANGSDLAPRVATRLRTGLITNCTMVKISDQGILEVTKPIYEDKIYSTVTFQTSALPHMITIRPGAIGAGKPDSSRQAQIVGVQPSIETESIRTKVVDTIAADARTLDLTEAEIIVAGGAGVGLAENWRLIEELGDVLGAAIGGSRMALDAGWITRERLVGQSGKSIKPDLYIALGISGASQHNEGMKDSERVIAINKDSAAPIFKLANLSIIADLCQVVPELIKKLRQLK